MDLLKTIGWLSISILLMTVFTVFIFALVIVLIKFPILFLLIAAFAIAGYFCKWTGDMVD